MTFDSKLPDDRVNVSEEHPLRNATQLILGVVLLAAITVFAIGFAVDLFVPHIPPRWEQHLFSLVESVGERDEAKEGESETDRQRVQNIVDRLSQHWEGRPYALRVGILESEDLNAMAVPGGLIFVTRGLLATVETETELALVLGHEIGHFRQRDHLRGLGRGIGLAIVLSLMHVGDSSGVLDVMGGASGLADRHFDREQERGSDRVGLELVFREYGHVSGATDFFARLPKPSGAIERRFQNYLSTHPAGQDRIKTLHAIADRMEWRRDLPAPPWAASPGRNQETP